jgi:hypothetical protein
MAPSAFGWEPDHASAGVAPLRGIAIADTVAAASRQVLPPIPRIPQETP